jgi:hypothetical protein
MTWEDLRSWRREQWKDPVFWSDVIQLVKTVAAAVIAWLIATKVLHLPLSFLAPWSALLVVHATVYRTFSRGARQVGAAVLGVLIAWMVGNLLGLDASAVAVVLVLGLAIGALPWFEGESTTAAATALVVLATGFSDNDGALVLRLVDTGVGIAVGLFVNFVVWPPLRSRTAIAAMDALDDRIGQLLVEMGDGIEAGCTREDVDGWVDRTRVLDEELDHAWSMVRQAKESARMNPRRSADELRDPRQWISLMRHMEQALADTRSLARTLSHALAHEQSWEPEFRGGFAGILRQAGGAIENADQQQIRESRVRLDGLVELVDTLTPAPCLWPVYGGLIINLRNILDAMDEVAGANPMSQPPLPFRRVVRT